MAMQQRTLTARQMEMGKMVVAGVPPVDAYQKVYKVNRKSAQMLANKLMQRPKMQEFTSRLIANTRREVLPLRAEVRDFLLSTMRDGEVAMEHRLRAAKQLCDLEGFEVKQVSSVDEAEMKWRAALISEMRSEPLVKEMGQVKAIDV